MIGVLPQRARFSIERLDADRCRFSYQETCHRDHSDMFAITVNAIRSAVRGIGSIRVRSRGNTVYVSGIGSTAQVTGMIVGEFLPWSSIGRLSLGELVISASAGAIAVRNNPGAAGFSPMGASLPRDRIGGSFVKGSP